MQLNKIILLFLTYINIKIIFLMYYIINIIYYSFYINIILKYLHNKVNLLSNNYYIYILKNIYLFII
jgi:hypothetical protein